MTEKLYDRDAYLCECDALVTKCEKDGENYKIYLDKTIFFARGGGQLADTGFVTSAMGKIRVLNVKKTKDGNLTAKSLKGGLTEVPIFPAVLCRSLLQGLRGASSLPLSVSRSWHRRALPHEKAW